MKGNEMSQEELQELINQELSEDVQFSYSPQFQEFNQQPIIPPESARRILGEYFKIPQEDVCSFWAQKIKAPENSIWILILEEENLVLRRVRKTKGFHVANAEFLIGLEKIGKYDKETGGMKDVFLLKVLEERHKEKPKAFSSEGSNGAGHWLPPSSTPGYWGE